MPINLQKDSFEKIHRFEVKEGNASFITEFVDQLFQTAIETHASDLHFEPQQTGMIIRARIDGLLYPLCQPSKSVTAAILSHLKIRAQVDIAEKRLPQDGRFRIQAKNRTFYVCRLNSLPTLHGEKIVIRLLAINRDHPKIDALGLQATQQKTMLQQINKHQGLILITGPTGSGKTTTLYSLLALLNSQQKNITSLENPVEIELKGINQLNIDEKIGLSFQTALKALLRQDPDIIMVGEIRDCATAKLVIQAAQTGHLVLATLHTNSTLATLSRLRLMGISPLDLTETLNLIVAQRLLRTFCLHCQAKGCQQCKQGYAGRTGIFEMLPISKEIRQMLLAQKTLEHIEATVSIKTLWQKGLEKVDAGITSLEELKRVTSQ